MSDGECEMMIAGLHDYNIAGYGREDIWEFRIRDLKIY